MMYSTRIVVMSFSRLSILCLLVPSVTFASQIDISAPELLGLTITPNTVDVTSGEQTVDVAFEFADNLSGLDYMALSVYNPSGNAIDYAFAYIDSWSDDLVSGDSLGGILETSFTIPQYAEEGDYTYRVSMDDKNNNNDYIRYDELVSMGFGDQLSVISATQDTVAPELLGLTITPNTVDVTSGEQTVDVAFEFADNLSGLDYMALSVYNPSGNAIDYAFAYIDSWSDDLVSGDSLGGILETSFTIPRYAEEGDYTYRVSMDDKNNNNDYIRYDELVSMGFGDQLSVGVTATVSEPKSFLIAGLGLILLSMGRRTLKNENLCA
jgi:hypothetical protein